MNLGSPSWGQYLMKPFLEEDEIFNVTKKYIKPYYREWAEKVRNLINQHFPADKPWRLHQHLGSFFFWLWLDGTKLSSVEVYEKLKNRGVAVVPGDYFFPGYNTGKWPHAHECLRINFARPDSDLEKGIKILAEVLKTAWETV
jgi:valine--pyruvate aminotransferase